MNSREEDKARELKHTPSGRVFLAYLEQLKLTRMQDLLSAKGETLVQLQGRAQELDSLIKFLKE